MALPNVAPVLAKEFVPLKLDIDRQNGALALALRYSRTEQGVPWFAFVNAAGVDVKDSTAPPPTNNIGHPYQPDEVAWFRTMLQSVKHHLTDADIANLIATLQSANKR